LARAVLRQAPTAQRMARRQASSLARVKTERKGRSLGVERAEKLIRLAQRSIASAKEDHDEAAMVFLIDQLELLEKRLAHIDHALIAYARQAQGETEQPGPEGVSIGRQIGLLDSITGIAIVAASTLVLGTRGLARFDSGKALSAQWATCPERIETGTSLKKSRLTARGDHKKRGMLYLCAQTACSYDPAFAFHKWRMIRNGLCPQQAVCAAMNRMARVIWALVARNQEYDVNRMLHQIQIHHADFWNEFVRLHQADRALWKKVDSKFKNIA
jgi:transposase